MKFAKYMLIICYCNESILIQQSVGVGVLRVFLTIKTFKIRGSDARIPPPHHVLLNLTSKTQSKNVRPDFIYDQIRVVSGSQVWMGGLTISLAWHLSIFIMGILYSDLPINGDKTLLNVCGVHILARSDWYDSETDKTTMEFYSD